MKPVTKTFLGVSLSLLAAGSILNVAGAAMGGREESLAQSKLSPFILSPDEFHIGGADGIHLSPGRINIGGEEGVTFSPGQIGIGGKTGFSTTDTQLSPFTDLEVEVDLADISVVEGEDYAVDMFWESDRFRLFHAVEDGELKIWSENKDGRVNVTSVSANVIITLPAGAELGEVDISTDLGSVTWEAAVSAREAELSAGLGSVTCSGLLAWELEGSSDMGSVDILLPGPREDFRWELEGNMGQLSLDSETQSGGMGELLVTGGTGERLVKASTDMGSVDVSFS